MARIDPGKIFGQILAGKTENQLIDNVHLSVKKPHILIAALTVWLMFCSGPDSGQDDYVVAEVKGQTLTMNEIRRNVPEYIFQKDSVSAIIDYRRNWVNRQLLIQEARRTGLMRNKEVREKIRHAEEDILARALIDLTLKEIPKNEIDRQDALAFYEVHKDQFILNEDHLRYRHLIAESMSAAQNARNALSRGVSWEEVARRYSVDPEAAIINANKFWPQSLAAGDYGPMQQYLQRIGISERSPIEVVNGKFHFVQLKEVRNKGDHPDIEWVLDHIGDWLLQEKKRRTRRAFERNLYLKAESNNEIRLYDVHNLEQSE